MSASLALIAGMTAAMYTLAPSGFYRFCAEHTVSCSPRFGDVIPSVPMVDAVNRQVNAEMTPTAEADGADVWKVGGKTGDCEDYALTKRAALLKAGVASSRLRLATGITSSGEGHAVLVVTTDVGDLVLDNRTNALMPPEMGRLSIKTIQSSENPRMWLRVAR